MWSCARSIARLYLRSTSIQFIIVGFSIMVGSNIGVPPATAALSFLVFADFPDQPIWPDKHVERNNYIHDKQLATCFAACENVDLPVKLSSSDASPSLQQHMATRERFLDVMLLVQQCIQKDRLAKITNRTQSSSCDCMCASWKISAWACWQ